MLFVNKEIYFVGCDRQYQLCGDRKITMGRCKCRAQGGKRPMPNGERTRPQRPRSTTRRETPGIQRGGQSHCRERVQQPTIYYEAGLDDRCRLHRPGADRGAARCNTGAEHNAAGAEEPARQKDAAQRLNASTAALKKRARPHGRGR